GDLGALAQRAGDLEVEEILAEGVGLLGLERVGARVLGEGLRVDRVEGELRLLAAREAEEADVSRRSAPVAAEEERLLIDARVLAPSVGLLPGGTRPERQTGV